MSPLRLSLFLALLWAPAFAGDDAVLATVNGAPITASAFQEAAARRTPADGKALSEAEREEVLADLIESELLYQDALRLGLDKDPTVKKVMINVRLRQLYGGVKNSDFSDAELQAYYNAHRDEFIVPEKVQIRFIRIAVSETRSPKDARALADDLHRQLVADPGQFKDLALEHSDDPYRSRGGDVGFVDRSGKSGLDPAVIEAAWRLPVDGLSEVFELPDGYGIVQVPARREAVERTYLQMKGSVLRKVKNERLRGIYEQQVTALKKDAKIKVNERALESVPAPVPAGRALGGGLGAPLEGGEGTGCEE